MSLTRGPIELDKLLSRVRDEGLGGTAMFLGSVRASPQDGDVMAIEYVAYEEMVVVEMERILTESQDRWVGVRVLLEHRLGVVPVGEVSIAVVAAAGHRAEAFDACRYVIEEAKKRLPIWKKESLRDGPARWRSNTPSRAEVEVNR